MNITKEQIITIQTIISQKGLRDQKEVIVTSASNGRTSSVSALTFDEAKTLINLLNSTPLDRAQKMRKYITAMAHEMNWITKSAQVTREGDTIEVNDYSNLHEWISKYGYLKKGLFKYTPNELPKLVTQMEGVYKSWLKKK